MGLQEEVYKTVRPPWLLSGSGEPGHGVLSALAEHPAQQSVLAAGQSLASAEG